MLIHVLRQRNGVLRSEMFIYEYRVKKKKKKKKVLSQEKEGRGT